MPGRNILGESFKPYVANQINVRQNKLAITNKYDVDTLKFINNNTSWVRLTSGVDISTQRASELGIGLTGADLAKNYILFSTRFSGNFTAGIGYSLDSTSYGFLSNSTYGLVPPPGIISAEIKPKNDKGTLRTANVQIECHNLFQFRVIEALYLRLKYSMLLEWGHTVFFDKDSNLQNAGGQDWVYQGFLMSGADQTSLSIALEKAREQSGGNYDGFHGWVENFTWTLKPNGGYDINLAMISLGDPIESLKLNVNYPQASTDVSSTATTNESSTPQPSVIANKNKSAIHQILFAIRTELNSLTYMDGPNIGGRSSLQGADIVRLTKLHSQYDLQGINYVDPNEKWDTANNILTYQEGIKLQFKNLTTKDDGTGGYFYYIKLGALLRIIETFLLKYDTSKGAAGSYKPLFYLDHDYDQNLCLTLPRQISTDPRICVLKSSQGLTSTNDQNDQAQVKTVYSKISFQSKREVKTGPFGVDIFASDNLYLEQAQTEVVTGDDASFNDSQILAAPPVITKEPQTDISGSTVDRIVQVDVQFKDGSFKTYYDTDNIGPFYIDSNSYNENDKVLTTDEDGEVTEEVNPNNISGLGDYFRVGGDEYAFLGKFMHIHVNLDFISTVLSSKIDTNGKISIYDFLEQIMQGIQTATGNINDYRILYDEQSNTFYINDNSTLPNADKYFNVPSYSPTPINANTLKDSANGGGSFVTNVSLKSELNNNYATLISVAAQSNSNVVGEDATAFSRWNEGYTDRIIVDRSSVVDQSTTSGTGSKAPGQTYLDNLIKYADLNNKINSGFITAADITNNGQSVVDMLKYEIAYFAQQDCIQGQGFLPINLQLTMLGLSGPRLLESYTIDETLLPENYKNKIKFLTKGITHRIDNSGWSTTLDSFMGPRLDSLNKATFFVAPEREIAARKNNGGNEFSDTVVGVGNGVNANKLRATLKSLGYSEKGSEIDSGGVDINASIEKVASSIFTTIKAEIPTLNVKVTGGNDKYHQGLSSNSRHKAGNALDFVISPSQTNQLDQVVNILRRYAVGNDPNFRFIDEYRNPSGAATAGHFHISWGGGTEAQAALALALALAKDGKISNPITV